MAYETTTVAVEKSQGAIRTLLTKHRAQQFGFGEELDAEGRSWAAVSFTAQGLLVRIRVPHKPVNPREVSLKLQRSRSKSGADIEAGLREQEAKRIWRVLHWNLKARLEAVEEEVESMAQAFLPHIVNPATGQTIYDSLVNEGSVALPKPLLALPSGSEAVRS